MLVLEGSLVRWIPCKGSRDSAAHSRINEVKLSHGLLLKLHPGSVSFKCLLMFAGIERRLRKVSKTSSEVSSMTSKVKFFRFTGTVAASGWGRNMICCTLKTSSWDIWESAEKRRSAR